MSNDKQQQPHDATFSSKHTFATMSPSNESLMVQISASDPTFPIIQEIMMDVGFFNAQDALDNSDRSASNIMHKYMLSLPDLAGGETFNKIECVLQRILMSMTLPEWELHVRAEKDKYITLMFGFKGYKSMSTPTSLEQLLRGLS